MIDQPTTRAVLRPLSLAFLPVLLIISVAALLTLHFSQRLRENYALVLHTYEVMETARSLLSDLQDAESSQRGFIITQRQDILEPYRTALRAIPGRLTHLKRLTSDNPMQQERLTELESLIETRVGVLRRTVELASRGDVAAAEAEILRGQGTAAMNGIRGKIGEIIATESTLLTQRVEQASQAEQRTLVAAMSGTALGLIASLAGVGLLLASNRRLRATETDLARQGTVLQATLDHVRDGVAAFDPQGRLIAFNQRFFDSLGLPKALAAPGETLDRFRVHGDAALRPMLAMPQPTESSRRSQAQDRFRHVTIAGREIEVYRNQMPDGGLVISAVDVTQRLRTEAVARQAQKMEAIGQLTGGVAHDFNNLLQTIGSNLDLLARDLKGDPEATRRLTNAVQGVERGARLTAQLLAFARRQPLSPRVVNLGRLVQGLADLLRRTLGEQVSVEAMVQGGLWNTLVDPSQVENALLNLAINARDAMPEGGKLTIELSNAFLDEEYAAAYSDVSPGQYVLLAVTDTGTGMTAETLARAFEPFFTTKPEGRGTGLGLSQVYGFVKQSGGHIKIYSEVGEGTTVKIYLPRSRKAEDELATRPAGTVTGGSETILVVEDDAAVRMAAVEMLQELGYRVLWAEHAEAALAILSGGVAVDLLFTDVVMPGPIKTRELARRAQELSPGLVVLYTSGYTENAIIHDGRLDEGVQLLSKPYRRDELARRVRQALDGAERPRAALPAPPAPVPDGRARRVLVVEDDALVRMSMVETMRDGGYTVVEASTGGEALALLRNEPKVDLLVTDLGLPGMGGEELARRAREIYPNLPILIATGQPAPKMDRLDGEAHHDFVWLTKPFLPDDLARAIELLLEHHGARGAGPSSQPGSASEG